MADGAEEIQKHIKTYLLVGLVLLAGTLITVAVAKITFFDLGGPGVTAPDIIVGLMIATVKVAFVMLIFMHLNHEKPLIYKILAFTVVFAIGLFFLTYLAWVDPAVFDDFWTTSDQA
jgi:caa(3)-type oxidase subunit IV